MFGIIAQLKTKVTQYIDVYVKLAKINFIEGASNLLSYFMFSMIILFILFCIILFLGFCLVEVFVNAGFSKVLSFLFAMCSYLLLLALVIGWRKKIIFFFANQTISVLTEGDDEKIKEDEE
jgi:hypothetical protein